MKNKIIIYANNIDERMIGKTILGYTIHKIYHAESTGAARLSNSYTVGSFSDKMFGKSKYTNPFINSDSVGDYCWCFIKEVDDSMLYSFDETAFVECISFFKSTNIILSNPERFRGSGGKNLFFLLNIYKYAHNDLSFLNDFYLNEIEIKEFEYFYEQYLSFKNLNREKTLKVDRMIELWFEINRITSEPINFVLLVTLMEMIQKEKAEMSFRLQLIISGLISNNVDECKEIQKNIKKIYNARSLYVHGGDEIKITKDLHFYAHNYARQVIVKMVIFALSKIEISDVIEEIYCHGYFYKIKNK